MDADYDVLREADGVAMAADASIRPWAAELQRPQHEDRQSSRAAVLWLPVATISSAFSAST